MLMQVLLLLALTTRGPQQAHGTGRRGGLSTPVAVRAAGLAESPTVVSLTVESALASAAGAYSRATAEQPLALAAVQAAGLRCIGDRIAQQLFLYRGELASVSPQHIAAMGLIGFIVSGAGNFVWINHLEEKLGASVGPWDVLRKAGSDFVCWAPLANCAYLFGVPLLTGATPDLAAHNMQHEFLPTMGMELSIFAPYNLFAFSLIPLRARPISSALTSLLFTIAIASRC